MKKLLQKYFILVAENPIIAVLWLIFLPIFIPVLILLAFSKDVPDFQDFLTNDLMTWVFWAMLAIAVLNIMVPFFFMTYFYNMKRRIVLIKPDGIQDAAVIYRKPLWGKVPYAEIIFPEFWDMSENNRERELELHVIFPMNGKLLAFIVLELKFILNGDFQAEDLEEMIQARSGIWRNRNCFHFNKSLEKILAKFLSDRRELVRDDIIAWQQKKLKAKELEQKWFKPDLIFGHLFADAKKIEVNLRPPEIIRTREKN
ncbi:MAG: hypothetical protein HY931_03130 [Candidatus Falkowbacteria bacterium]|nr:MAG: hypothetical protein HY931_03130 [Candidatus Falkowbacteria bacterium]